MMARFPLRTARCGPQADARCYNFHVENRRANDSGRVLLWRDVPSRHAGRSPIGVSAVLSLSALVAVVLWQAIVPLRADNTGDPVSFRSMTATAQSASADATSSDAARASNPNDFSQIGADAFGTLIGTYVSTKQSGTYTPAQGETIANTIADSVQAPVSYTSYTKSDVATDADTSYRRMLAYRSDLRRALTPLLLNTKPELGMFEAYVETGDKSNLDELAAVAGRYRESADAAMRVIVPKDAVSSHLGVANSLLKFSVTLEAMVKNANDPMATLALLRTYNDAEQYVFTSFNALASYEKSKLP